MKTALTILVAAICLVVVPGRCLASRSVGIVTKEQAKEMGVDLKASPSGPDACWLELEFKPEGKLKQFHDVLLDIHDGEKLIVGWTSLKDRRTESGNVVITLMASRAHLDKITLSIVVGDPGNLVHHELRVKDFIDPAKIK
jgi:hypothetical protein